MAYDPNNVFARILRGEIPAHKVFEDVRTLAFMDVMPQADGHTLVIIRPRACSSCPLTTSKRRSARRSASPAP